MIGQMSSGQALKDPGGERRLCARWTITADLLLESATHFSGEEGGAVDMALLRDGCTGAPLLPGTSLAGALRSHLADVLAGYQSEEHEAVARLFGAARKHEAGGQSPLIVFDSVGVLDNDARIEIRDGVQIKAESGIAEDHKKFDFEVLPAGTHFPLRFDLLVPQEDKESELISLLLTALSGLASGDIRLGARRSRGLGALRGLKWRAKRYELTSSKTWVEWLLSNAEPAASSNTPGMEDPREACRLAYSKLDIHNYEDRRERVCIDVYLKLKAGLLVRSAPMKLEEPDVVHLRSAGISVLPGTSLAGTLRRQALRIARLAREGKREGKEDADSRVNELFGSTHGASRLRISESDITGSNITGDRRMRVSRICVDRFTQGTVPGALFDEELEYHGSTCIRLELRNRKNGELGLLLLTLKDLMDGKMAVGGTSAVGRGIFEGDALLRFEDGRQVTLAPATQPDPLIVEDIEKLWSEETA